jgi:nucleoside-diphosphate-sugar epimerase
VTRRALITGIGGQDGSLLAELLLDQGYDVFGIVRRSAANYPNLAGLHDRVELIQGDLTDQLALVRALRACRPHEVYNLASVSFVPMSWEQPVVTAELAAVGATALLEAIREVDPEIRFYQASSSEIFGEPVETPQTELTPLAPLTPYGVAKAYAHFITRSYRRRYGLHACAGILYNHESPRRPLEFLPSKVANAAAAIKLGLRAELWLGDLSAQRDWGYRGAAHRRGACRACVRARRARMACLRSDRRVPEARQGRAARPRGRPCEGAHAAGLEAGTVLRGARGAARRRGARATLPRASTGGERAVDVVVGPGAGLPGVATRPLEPTQDPGLGIGEHVVHGGGDVVDVLRVEEPCCVSGDLG